MAHTPGPWSMLPQRGAGPMIIQEYETGNQMNPTGFRIIAHMMQRGNSLDVDRANACLIAAAPDLLEALENVIDAASEFDPRQHPRWPEIYKAALSAIHAARGKP